MDTGTLILSVVSAIGGGTILKACEKIFGNNKVKELSDIIESMRKRIDDQDKRIEKLEKENSLLVESEHKNVILEVAMSHGEKCEYINICPIHKKFNELSK